MFFVRGTNVAFLFSFQSNTDDNGTMYISVEIYIYLLWFPYCRECWVVPSFEPLADERGHLLLVTPNLVRNAVVGSFPSASVSPVWMKNFVVAILSEWGRHIPQEKQLPTGIQVMYLGSWAQPLCSIWFPKVIQRTKDQCRQTSVQHDLSPMVSSYLYLQPPEMSGAKGKWHVIWNQSLHGKNF